MTAAPPPVGAPTCPRHPARVTYVRCVRCERSMCGECMRAASVGHQCVDCVAEGARSTPKVRTRLGGRQRGGAPVLTWSLIAVNVVVFALQVLAPSFERAFTLVPLPVADGQWWRLLTSAFLHYGLVHLALNMWVLYVIGGPLEAVLGRARFAALYVLSALGGSTLVYLLTPLNTATAGASGAVFGLFGATFVVARRLNLDVRGVVVVIGLNLAFTFVFPLLSSQAISWQGHIGGLVVGAAVAAVFAYAPRARQKTAALGGCVVVAVVLAGLIVWRTIDLVDRFGLTRL